MKTQFTPIAMRCTEEQFKAIEQKFKKNKSIFVGYGFGEKYLTNNFGGISLEIGTTWEEDKCKYNRMVYETWDEATFLKACGIEVNTYTVSKDFILEAHKDACQTWKTKIENQFPELFPKVELELNKWYKVKTKGYDKEGLICFDNDKLEHNYGFNHIGVFSKSFRNLKECLSDDNQEVELATKEEVETALIAEAKKRGFKNGVNIVDLYNGKSKGDYVLISSDDFDYEKVPCGKLQGKMALRDSDGNILFVDGKWAEIISEPIELSLDEIAEKFGVDVSLIKIKK